MVSKINILIPFIVETLSVYLVHDLSLPKTFIVFKRGNSQKELLLALSACFSTLLTKRTYTFKFLTAYSQWKKLFWFDVSDGNKGNRFHVPENLVIS